MLLLVCGGTSNDVERGRRRGRYGGWWDDGAVVSRAGGPAELVEGDQPLLDSSRKEHLVPGLHLWGGEGGLEMEDEDEKPVLGRVVLLEDEEERKEILSSSP